MNVKDIMPRRAEDCTPEVMEAWKKAYPSGVFELVVHSGDFDTIQVDGKPDKKVPIVKYKGYMRKPTRNEMREFTASKADPVTYTENILTTLWLGGDEEIKTNDEAFYSVMTTVQGVLDVKDSEIKKV